MEQVNFEHAYQLKKLELEALLEVTQAINSNLPEEQLYRIFYFTLRANLNIDKFALYVYERDRWLCKVSHSSAFDFKGLPLDKTVVREIAELSDTGNLPEVYRKEFQQVFPIRHKEQTLAYMFLNNGKPGRLDEGDGEMKFVRALTNITIVAIENKKLARQQLEQKAMQKELEIAKDVQRFLFPNSLPNTPKLHVEARYLPHHQVGGDYYDYIEVGQDKFLVCVADVSGKGVPAAILMANFQASLRTLVRKTADLEEIVNELNHQVMQNAHGENFITAFLGLYDKVAQRLTYVNSGHNPPFLIQKNGEELSMLEKGSTILGIMDELPFLNVGEVENLPEFLLFCYTDGLTETFNDREEIWGPEDLEEFLKRSSYTDLNELIEALIQEIDTFRNGQPYHDDVTLLACAYKGR
jgi:sigma-B regulation protein RsbU (phosphoserine phosphatase)